MDLKEKRGCSNKVRLFLERESFGSREAALFNGFNVLQCKHRKLYRLKRMLISVTELNTLLSQICAASALCRL